MFRVYRHGDHPKPKKHFYPNEFKKRQQARVFCKNRWHERGLTIVHPCGKEEVFKDGE